jgi:hypothetical protein
MTTPTQQQKKRIIQSIIETERLLEREMRYSQDLRDNKLVEFYNNHLKKLYLMLN